MIKSFGNAATLSVFEGRAVKDLQSDMQERALAKLQLLHAAGSLEDLAAVASNKLELLTGDREGKHCIRINEQYRICFRWENGDVHQVEVADYH